MDKNDIINDKQPVDIKTDYGKGLEPEIETLTDYGKGLEPKIDSLTDYGKEINYASKDGTVCETIEQLTATNQAYFDALKIEKDNYLEENDSSYHR